MSRTKIGLALSGGGARGFAHIGILKVLEDAQVPIDYIGGTSMGGLIAAAYACGIPLQVVEEKAMLLSSKREMMKLVDLSRQRRGLLEGNRVRAFLTDMFLDRTFDSLRIPLTISAVDLIEAREVVLTDGLVFPAVLATIAVPGLFTPVEIGPKRLVDGGVLNNLPIDRVRELGAETVIGVDAQINPSTEKPWQDLPAPMGFPMPVPAFFLDFYRAELIMVAELTKTHLKENPPDLLIRPPLPPNVDMFLGFNRIPEIIAAGMVCARKALPQILALLD